MDLRPQILVIVGAAMCALLIAAVNFDGLLLTRVIEREGEFVLHAALGASRRTTRQATAYPGALARFHRNRAWSAHCIVDYTNAIRALAPKAGTQPAARCVNSITPLGSICRSSPSLLEYSHSSVWVWFAACRACIADRFTQRDERYLTRGNTGPKYAQIARLIRRHRARDCRCAPNRERDRNAVFSEADRGAVGLRNERSPRLQRHRS